MLNLQNRNLQPELMDDPNLSKEELLLALKDLDRLNKISLTATSISNEIKKLIPLRHADSITILDLGSGSGAILCETVKQLLKAGVNVTGIGIDLNPVSIEQANLLATKLSLPVTFQHYDAIQALKSIKFDIAISSLFLHHLPENLVQELFENVSKHAKIGMVMSDLNKFCNCIYCNTSIFKLKDCPL